MNTTTKKFCATCNQEYQTDQDTCPICACRLTPIMATNLVGTVVDGRYTITDVLGRGGMGVVYRARQAYLDRDVALKVMRRDLSEDTDMIRRFLQEAKSASRLTSPHTVTIHDFGLTPDGQMYFTMELLEGISLAELMLAKGTVPYPRAVRLAVQCCHSLQEAHSHGIWHRDMKPENIIITRGKRNQDHAKILDFGIAKVRGGSQTKTQTGMIFGSPRYLSPEQTNNLEMDHRTDLYSLGVLLYEMLMGEAPFDGESTVSVLMMHVQKPPPPFREKNPAVHVPADLEAAVLWALAKQPEDRPPTAEAFATALLDAIGEDSETSLGLELDDDKVFTAAPGASEAVPEAQSWEDPEDSWIGSTPSGARPLATEKIDRFLQEAHERTRESWTSGPLPGEDGPEDELTPPGAFRADHRRGALIGALVVAGVLALVGLGMWQPWVPAAPSPAEDVATTPDAPAAATRDVPVLAPPVTDVVEISLTETETAPDVSPEDLSPEAIAAATDGTPQDIAPETVAPPEIVAEDLAPELRAEPDIAPMEDVPVVKDPPKKDPPKKDPPKKDPPKKAPPKKDPPKKDPPKKDPPKVDPPKVDPPKKDPEDEYTEIPLGA